MPVSRRRPRQPVAMFAVAGVSSFCRRLAIVMMLPVACDHFPDRVVVRVGEEDVARRVDGDGVGAVQLSVNREPAVALVTRFTVTGDGDDLAGRRDDLAEYVVGVVGEEHRLRRSRGRTPRRAVDLGVDRGLIVAGVTRLSVTGDGDLILSVDATTSRILSFQHRVADEQVARGVDHGDAVGAIQFGFGRELAVAVVPGCTIAGDGDDLAGRLYNLADHVVITIDDEQVAGGRSTAMPAGAFSSAAVAARVCCPCNRLCHCRPRSRSCPSELGAKAARCRL